MQRLFSIPARWAVPAALTATLLAAAFLASGVVPRSAGALTNCSVSESELALDSYEQEFLRLINAYRAANGRGALKASTNLNRAAAWMAKDLATDRYFAHDDNTPRAWSTRIRNCGYSGSGIAENIAAGNSEALATFNQWKNSPGHNTNMLNGTYKVIGIGRAYNANAPYRYYWVTDFGTTDDSGSSSTPTATATSTPTQTATATATPTSTSTIKAVMTSPVNGSSVGTSTTFRWTRPTGATYFRIDVGTSRGGRQILSSTTTNTSRYVSRLPSGTFYVRLWTRQANGTWIYNDYQYR